MQPYPYAMQPMLNMPMGRAPFPQGAPPLYIGNLDDTVYEEQLFSHFSKYGPIHSLKIAKDPNSGRSRGFGYINFMQAKDAENARMLSQYEKIGKNPIRLMYKRNVRDTNESNVFVMNIDHTVSFKELHNLFAHVGNVLTVKINTNRKGESLGYGYVLMDKKEDALKAIETLNNHKLKEKEITTSIFVPKGQRNVSANKNLYVKGLPGDKSKEEIEALLREKFGKFGNILSLAAVFSDKDHRWFAFVCFENANEAEEAIKNIHETNAFLPEEPTYVAWHQSRFERDAELKKKHLHSKNDTNLFVKNLKADVTDQTLRTAFSQFGEISSVAVNKREIKPEDTRAFGFVAFKHAQDALKAQSEGHRTEEIKQLFIEGQDPYINFWQPKGQRDQYKASKSRHPFGGQRRGGPFGSGYMNNNMFPPMNMNYMRMGFPPMHMMNPQFQRQQRGGYGQPRHVAGARRGGAQGGRPHQGGAVGPYNGGARGGSNYRGNQGRSYGQNQSQYQARPNQDRSYTPGQQAAQPQAQAQSSSKDIKPRAPGTTLDVASNLTVAGLKDKLDDFLKLEPEKQRNILGELLYPKIVGKSGTSHAPKITGMLVDFDVLTVQDILEMLEDEQVLHERIQEAQELINQEGEQ